MQAAVYMDDGTLCVLQEGGRVSIYALSGACGCSNIRTATCETVAGGDRVVVTSRTLITNTGASTCPDVCYTESALCSGEVPGEGRYEVTYGSEQAVVELPLGGPLQLFGPEPSSSCERLVETLEALSPEERGGGYLVFGKQALTPSRSGRSRSGRTAGSPSLAPATARAAWRTPAIWIVTASTTC